MAFVVFNARLCRLLIVRTNIGTRTGNQVGERAIIYDVRARNDRLYDFAKLGEFFDERGATGELFAPVITARRDNPPRLWLLFRQPARVLVADEGFF